MEGYDETMAGRKAECDGGGFIEGTHLAGRQEFAGTLTGHYVEQGVPPWRWYLMVDLTLKPAQWEHEAVWCLQGNIFLVDG